MSTEKDNGGPAFGQVVELRCVRVDPNGATDWEPEAMLQGGLTVRDYFAAKALQGICATGPGNHMSNDQIAAEAYWLADAMLEARKK